MRAISFVGRLALLLVLSGASVAAQEIQLQQKHTRWRVGYQEIEADGKEDLGLIGLHYDVLGVLDVFPALYLGAGGFVGATGNSGGFFLAGLTVGGIWQPAPMWILDSGVFAGGGGGGGGLAETGLAMQPFVAIERSFGLYGLRAEFAYFDMDEFEGDWTASIGFTLASELLIARDRRQTGRISFDSIVRRETRVGARTLWLRPSDDSVTRGGDPMTVDIGTVGLGIDYFLDDYIYFPIEAYGAVRGDVGGFVMASAGVGVSVPITRGTSFEIAASAVTGGGGNVSTRGAGWHARAGVRTNVLPNVALEVMGGALSFPDGDFDADTLSVGLSWSAHPIELALDYPRGNLGREGLSDADAEIRATRVELLTKFYSPPSSATKKDGSPHDETISLVGFGIEEPIGWNISLTARAFAAYAGDVGGYSEGLLGVRYEYSAFGLPRHHFGLSAEAGAGGGGGVDVGSGLIAHLAAGWRYDLSDDFQIDLEFGKVEANHGSFEAESISFGVIWNLSRALLRE